MNYFISALIGLAGGMASGLFGVGGGVVMVPAMMFFLGMPIHHAVGTSLLVIIPTSCVGSWQHHEKGNVQWAIAASLIPTALIGGFLGARLANQMSPDNLKKSFGCFLILVGLRLLFFK